MALFNVSPRMAMSPATHDAGLEAMGLWLLAGTFSSNNGTPGFIAAADVRTFTTKRKPVARLLEVGLWEAEGGGYRFRGDGEFWRVVDRVREPISLELRTSIYKRDGWACLHCGGTRDLTLDHIWPWSKGGPDTAENLQTLCRSCNSRKGAKTPA